ncbi:MAG: VPLPA-CTERM sorting domain-containing protein [Gammaproteobacteria bacterium]
MTLNYFQGIVVCSLVAAALPAGAAVIDFETLKHDDGGVNNIDSPYIEAGYIIQDPGVEQGGDNNAFAVYGTDNPNFSGSTALYNRAVNGVTSVSRQDGAAFNLFSIDLAELNGNVTYPSVLSVTFEGLFTGGGVVTQTFQLDGDAFGAETFVFNGFNNLASVTWMQETPFHQFDNIVVNAVPVPAAAWLFASGFLGLAGVARRKQ